jgi:hypothetical protein
MRYKTIKQKFQKSSDELLLGFVSGSTQSVFEYSENITNSFGPEISKLQGIKYFHFEDTINGFSNLKPNWDSYNADPISENSINAAIETLNYLYSKGQLSNNLTISIFPMRNGGVQFEFDGVNICAELEISTTGERTFIIYDDKGSIVNKGQLFELSELSTLLEESQYAI